jgi:transcriptional regulator with XRE-family HTH domain
MKTEATRDKEAKALRLRRHRGLTFKRIGDAMGVSKQMAYRYCKDAENEEKREGAWDSELSYRTSNIINNFGINDKEEAREALLSGRLGLRCRNYGVKTHKELCEWAGVPFK